MRGGRQRQRWRRTGGGRPPRERRRRPAVQKDAALAALVPSDVASDGKIVVGSDASYAPNEFVDTDGTTIIGMDVDLGKAIGQKLGLEVEFQNSAFDGILPGIAAKKYELGMSSFTDNAEREKAWTWSRTSPRARRWPRSRATRTGSTSTTCAARRSPRSAAPCRSTT